MRNSWPIISLLALFSLVPETFGFESIINVHKRTLKQYNPRGTATVATTSDTCGSFNADIGSLLGSALGITLPGSSVDQCLCRSAITTLAVSNSACTTAASEKGVTAVLAALEDIFDNHVSACSGKKTCTYPANAFPMCSTSNVCAFGCTNGYTLSGSSCVCSGHVCSGICQTAACPTVSGRGLVPPSNYNKNMQPRDMYCPKGETMCGYDMRKQLNSLVVSRGYDCIETTSNKQSCGGCSIPLLYGGIPTGSDCSAIPNASNVDCIEGACYVKSCKRGYTPNDEESECVRRH